MIEHMSDEVQKYSLRKMKPETRFKTLNPLISMSSGWDCINLLRFVVLVDF